MSIKAFPLNQQEYSYNAQDVMKYYAGRNSGVFETGENLKVSANGGLEIRVNSGMGWLSRDYVASVAFWNESVEYLMVNAGHDTYDRVDLVVVSWNFVQQEQNPKLIIKKGTPASSPAVPSLVNNSSTIEIALARINVGKGDIELSDSDIVDLRGDDTYCPMVYDEQTIREAFRKCVGYADGVNKISDFPSVTPASSDKILIEQGEEGKSATLADLPISAKVQSVLDTKINKTDSLSYEEIMASTDLSGKVASASALKELATLDLLWENANPSSAFEPQTINLDLSDYKMVCVTFKNYIGTELYIDSFSFIDGKKYDASIPNNDLRHRAYTVNHNNIVFDNAVYAHEFGGQFIWYNASMIPTHIYGIKGGLNNEIYIKFRQR